MSKLTEFARKAEDGRVTFTSRIDPRRKVIVTKKSIVTLGNFQNATSGELQETPALYDAAVADYRSLIGSEDAGKSGSDVADKPNAKKTS